MTELNLPTEPAVATEAGKGALDVLFGVQRLIGDEIAFARDEMLDRAQAETHRFSEFLSKMAQAHSVHDLKMMYEVCGRHQVDFVCRNLERLFAHTRRSIDAASRLFDTATRAGALLLRASQSGRSIAGGSRK